MGRRMSTSYDSNLSRDLPPESWKRGRGETGEGWSHLRKSCPTGGNREMSPEWCPENERLSFLGRLVAGVGGKPSVLADGMVSSMALAALSLCMATLLASGRKPLLMIPGSARAVAAASALSPGMAWAFVRVVTVFAAWSRTSSRRSHSPSVSHDRPRISGVEKDRKRVRPTRPTHDGRDTCT